MAKLHKVDRWSLDWPEEDAPPSTDDLGHHAATRYRHFRRFIEELQDDETDNELFGLLLSAESMRDEMHSFEDEASLLVRLAQTGCFVRQLRKLHGVLDEVASAYGMIEASELGEWEAALSVEREERAKRYSEMLGSLRDGCICEDDAVDEDAKSIMREVESNEERAEEVLTLLKGAMDKYGATELTSEEARITQLAFSLISRHTGVIVLSLPPWFSLPFEYNSFVGLSRWGNDCFYPEHSDRERFIKEASAWSELNHPHVAKFLGACHVGVRPFIVHEKVRKLSEYVSGIDMEEESDRKKVWQRMYEVSLALQYMHERGVVCRGVSVDRTHCAQYEDRAVFLGVNLWSEDFVTLDSSEQEEGRHSEHCRVSSEKSLAVSVMNIFKDMEGVVESIQVPSEVEGFGIWASECPSYLLDAEWELLKKVLAMTDGGINRVVELWGEFAGVSDHRDWIEYIPKLKRQLAQSGGDIDLDEFEVTVSGETIRELLKQCCVLEHSADSLFDLLLMRINKICDRLRRRRAGGNEWSVMLVAVAHLGSLIRELVKFSNQNTAANSMSQSVVFSMSAAYSQSFEHQHDPRQLFALHSRVDRYIADHDMSQDELDRTWITEWTTQYSSPKTGSNTRSEIHNGQDISSSPRLSPWFIPREQVDFEAFDAFNEGAFGSIHRGKWFGTPVVVKRVKQPNAEADLRQEADVWFQLNHINVVKMYGACDIGDLFFVCEYASGGDLDKYLRVRGRNPYLMWYCLLNAALGLQYLHDSGIVHADLKANNILVGADGVAKLTDFGLSVKARGNEKDDINGGSGGGALGAYRWKAPECLSGSVATFASDVYSFAMVVIEIMSGCFPWGVEMSDAAVIHHVKKGVLPPRPSGVDDSEWSLIERMCCLDPADRVTMDGVVVHLTSLIQKLDQDELWLNDLAQDKIFGNRVQTTVATLSIPR